MQCVCSCRTRIARSVYWMKVLLHTPKNVYAYKYSRLFAWVRVFTFTMCVCSFACLPAAHAVCVFYARAIHSNMLLWMGMMCVKSAPIARHRTNRMAKSCCCCCCDDKFETDAFRVCTHTRTHCTSKPIEFQSNDTQTATTTVGCRRHVCTNESTVYYMHKCARANAIELTRAPCGARAFRWIGFDRRWRWR